MKMPDGIAAGRVRRGRDGGGRRAQFGLAVPGLRWTWTRAVRSRAVTRGMPVALAGRRSRCLGGRRSYDHRRHRLVSGGGARFQKRREADVLEIS